MHLHACHIFFRCLFQLLLVRDVWRRLRPRTPRLADTFIYFAWLDRITVSSPSYAVDARTADLLRRLDVIEPPMTFASVSGPHADDVSRLIPALTRHRSLVGHHMNVPDLERKEAWQARALERCDREALRQWGVDGLIVRSEDWDRLQAAAVAAGTPFGPGDRVVIEQDGVLVVLLAQSDQASSSSINLVTNTSVARPGL